MPAANDSDPHLCVTCGICCTGALFEHADATADEAATLGARGFALSQRDRQDVFLLGCGQLCGTACAIYAARPLACRAYQCTSLRELERGEIDRAEADRRVAATRAQVAQVALGLAPGERFADLRERVGREGAAFPALRLALAACDMMMDRWFREPRQRVLRRAGG